jgi:hypothetical protein
MKWRSLILHLLCRTDFLILTVNWGHSSNSEPSFILHSQKSNEDFYDSWQRESKNINYFKFIILHSTKCSVVCRVVRPTKMMGSSSDDWFC